MYKQTVITCLLFFSVVFPGALFSGPLKTAPEINAQAAILLDYKTGTVLYAKNADMQIPPASMTKLMTIHTVLKEIRSGAVSADDIVPISTNADFRNLPPRSSLMFLEEGQHVTLFELLQGLALPSGNDAGIAVAEYIYGGMDSFVDEMNREAAELGMLATHFDDSSGLSEKNITTPRDYAQFCRVYIEENSEYLERLHMPLSFTYPKPENLPPSESSVYGPITQPNHNTLIGRMAGVDGLKTGYIDESGYNIAATAELDGRRLVLVTMGGPGISGNDGAIKREIDAAVLFSYGFYAWCEYTPELPAHDTIKVWGAEHTELKIQYSSPLDITIKTAEIPGLKIISELNRIEPPVKAGAVVGKWYLVHREAPKEIIQTGTIMSAEDLEKGNIFRRIQSAVYRLIN